METVLTVNFTIRRFTSTRDKDFTKALIIYNSTIPVDTKTNSSEIVYHVDHAKIYTKREMFFFGLFVEDSIVGFVEAGYLLTTKTIIIDYIVLKEGYRLNSIFYPLFSLVQKYFTEHLIDYDFIVCLGDLVDDWNQEVNLNLYADTLDRCLDFAKYSERHADHGELFIRVATAVIDTIPNSE